MAKLTTMTVIVQFKPKITLYDAIKLRIAGAEMMKKLIENIIQRMEKENEPDNPIR